MQDYKKGCRLCLFVREKFLDMHKRPEIKKQISDFFGIEIQLKDPANICDVCFSKFNGFLLFRESVIKNTELVKYYKEQNNIFNEFEVSVEKIKAGKEADKTNIENGKFVESGIILSKNTDLKDKSDVLFDKLHRHEKRKPKEERKSESQKKKLKTINQPDKGKKSNKDKCLNESIKKLCSSDSSNEQTKDNEVTLIEADSKSVTDKNKIVNNDTCNSKTKNCKIIVEKLRDIDIMEINKKLKDEFIVLQNLNHVEQPPKQLSVSDHLKPTAVKETVSTTEIERIEESSSDVITNLSVNKPGVCIPNELNKFLQEATDMFTNFNPTTILTSPLKVQKVKPIVRRTIYLDEPIARKKPAKSEVNKFLHVSKPNIIKLNTSKEKLPPKPAANHSPTLGTFAYGEKHSVEDNDLTNRIKSMIGNSPSIQLNTTDTTTSPKSPNFPNKYVSFKNPPLPPRVNSEKASKITVRRKSLIAPGIIQLPLLKPELPPRVTIRRKSHIEDGNFPLQILKPGLKVLSPQSINKSFRSISIDESLKVQSTKSDNSKGDNTNIVNIDVDQSISRNQERNLTICIFSNKDKVHFRIKDDTTKKFIDASSLTKKEFLGVNRSFMSNINKVKIHVKGTNIHEDSRDLYKTMRLDNYF